jgi:hypothetical protein
VPITALVAALKRGATTIRGVPSLKGTAQILVIGRRQL